VNLVPEPRLDKWLWAVRLFKTRAEAAEACRAGHVTMAGQPLKPSRAVKLGDIVSARVGELTRTVKVLALIDRRIGPKLVDQCLEDLTPASEYLRVLEKKEQPGVPQRSKGSGRPTKKERRQIEEFEGIS